MNAYCPPLVIEVGTTFDNIDTDTYRTYTKSGTRLDFVVWPPLRLGARGPLLCKGIAQGKQPRMYDGYKLSVSFTGFPDQGSFLHQTLFGTETLCTCFKCVYNFREM